MADQRHDAENDKQPDQAPVVPNGHAAALEDKEKALEPRAGDPNRALGVSAAGSEIDRRALDHVATLNHNPDAVLDPTSLARDDRTTPLATSVDRYEYRRELGRGGMGDVRLFRDRIIGRDVAKKTLRDSGVGPDSSGYGRFVREARVQGQLEHPAIVPVHDLSVEPDGSLYFTMKNIRGTSLKQLLARLERQEREPDQQHENPYTHRKLLSVFDSVCQAVDFAHSRGVLHRDLKPANIMLGDFGDVYVLDWGLAKVRGAPELPADSAIAESESTDDVSSTRVGVVLGTPGYMAPEQFAGRVDKVDERSDVYALGIILFEMLTLESFHLADTVDELRWSTLNDQPIRPSTRRPDREIAPELDEICLRATAHDPSQRYQSVRELSHAIEGFLEGDRDLALRKDMANARAKEATLALERSHAPDADEAAERGRAMRAVTTALGLDPENRDARETLVEMLTTPPRTLPPNAKAEIEASDRMKRKHAAKMAALVYFGFIFYVPFPLWMGLRSVPAFLLLATSIGMCALSSLYLYRKPSRDPRVPIGHLLLSTLTVVVSAMMVGPFILVPMLALANTMVYITVSGPQRRWLIVLAGCLAIFLPWLLQIVELLPPSYRMQDGIIAVMPMMLYLPPVATTTFLLITHFMVILTGALYVSRLRDNFVHAERRLQLHAWQLRQIVPENARDSVASSDMLLAPPTISTR